MFKVRAPRRKASPNKNEAPHGPARSNTRPQNRVTPAEASALILGAGVAHATANGVFVDGLKVY